MVTCARRGCGADFVPSGAGSSGAAQCVYHPGAPVFHEGLKSWSCCSETNKPVMEFDQFMAIRGCATADAHTTEKQALPATAPTDAPATGASAAASHVTEDGKEVFVSSSSGAGTLKAPTGQPVTQPLTGASLSAAKRAATAQKQGDKTAEEADPASADAAGAVPAGTKCKRRGCGHASVGTGPRDRATESCSYHPGVPIFHEGSKGWSCCKPKVLDFDDFMKLPTCTASKHGHLYVGAPVEASEAYETVDARLDHYETPDSVRVSVYAKGAAPPPESEVVITADSVSLDLWMAPAPATPNVPRRVLRTLRPFAAVDPAKSSFTIGKFKTELVLAKAAPGVSWPALEAGEGAVGFGLTFGREVDAQHNGR